MDTATEGFDVPDEIEVSSEDLANLAAKIGGLELTAAEEAALDQIMYRASFYEADVEGFAMGRPRYKDMASGAGLSGDALRLGAASGFIVMPNLATKYKAADLTP